MTAQRRGGRKNRKSDIRSYNHAANKYNDPTASAANLRHEITYQTEKSSFEFSGKTRKTLIDFVGGFSAKHFGLIMSSIFCNGNLRFYYGIWRETLFAEGRGKQN